MRKPIKLSGVEDVERALHDDVFRADHPFRTSRRLLGISTLDLEGADHRQRKREWWSAFGKQWVEHDETLDLVDAAVAEGFSRALLDKDLFQACIYVPNKVVLSLLNLPHLDPIVHYGDMSPALRALGGSTEDRDLVEKGKAYIHGLARDSNEALFASLDDEAKSAELALFLVAGAETTVVALKIIVQAWWKEPSRIAEQVSLKGSEEVVMRLLSEDLPLGSTTRYASQDVSLAGVGCVERGSIVDVDLVAATKQSGDTEDQSRAQRYIFGRGTHRCPGGRLALLESQVFLETLIQIDASDYTPIMSSEPRSETFRHPTWRKLRKISPNEAACPGLPNDE